MPGRVGSQLQGQRVGRGFRFMNNANNQHTPGPWHVQADPEFTGGHPLHQSRFITCGNPDFMSEEWKHDPNSYIIASMRDCWNQRANAKLIAAAPELLSACKTAEAQIAELQSDVFDGRPVSNGKFEAALSTLRQAMSKAECVAEAWRPLPTLSPLPGPNKL